MPELSITLQPDQEVALRSEYGRFCVLLTNAVSSAPAPSFEQYVVAKLTGNTAEVADEMVRSIITSGAYHYLDRWLKGRFSSFVMTLLRKLRPAGYGFVRARRPATRRLPRERHGSWIASNPSSARQSPKRPVRKYCRTCRAVHFLSTPCFPTNQSAVYSMLRTGICGIATCNVPRTTTSGGLRRASSLSLSYLAFRSGTVSTAASGPIAFRTPARFSRSNVKLECPGWTVCSRRLSSTAKGLCPNDEAPQKIQKPFGLTRKLRNASGVTLRRF